MLRFVFFPVIAFAVVLSSTEAARAEVIVVRPEDASSQVVVKTKPPTIVVVKHTAIPPAQVSKPPAPPKRDRKFGLHFDVGGTFGPQVLIRQRLPGLLPNRDPAHRERSLLRQSAAQVAGLLPDGTGALVRPCRYLQRDSPHDSHRRTSGLGTRTQDRTRVRTERRCSRHSSPSDRQRPTAGVLRRNTQHEHFGRSSADLRRNALLLVCGSFLSHTIATRVGCCFGDR